MKVLFVQKMVGVSGSEKYIINILQLLREKGIEGEFCCVQNSGGAEKNQAYLSEMAEKGIPYHIINYSNSASPSIVLNLYRLIKSNKYDIVQSNLIHADLWSALIRKFTSIKTKFIGFYHGYDEYIQSQGGFDPDKNRKNLYYRLSRFASANHDFTVSISKGLAHFLTATGIVKKEKISVIHYGFNFGDIIKDKNYETKYRLSPHQLVIVGRLIPYKQQDLIIDILPDIKKQFPDISLVLVGNGSSREDLEKKIIELGLQENVHFTGFVQNTHDYIAASDIMIVPSKSEGFGVVLLEGFHNKKPVIAFDVPAPNEIIRDGENGFLIPPFDTGILKNRILELLSDKEKTTNMGIKAYETLTTEFTNENMLEKTIKLYKEVLQKKGGI
jgi:glycosyltransferase involved in cell wall biosynthesis